MRLALAALALAACARSPDLPPGGGWRRNFVELDNALAAAFAAELKKDWQNSEVCLK